MNRNCGPIAGGVVVLLAAWAGSTSVLAAQPGHAQTQAASNGEPGSNQIPLPAAAREHLLNWPQVIAAAQRNDSFTDVIAQLELKALREAEQGLWRRPYRFEDIGKHRSWLDKRAVPLEEEIRETFALAMSDFMMCWNLADHFPGMVAAAKLSGDSRLREFAGAQLREISTWRPLQRPGWTVYSPGRRLPPDGQDGNWLGTGVGIRTIVTAMDIMGDDLDPQVRGDLRSLLAAEIASIVDDWKTKRTWFIQSNNAITNQWVLPTEGLVRACLHLGVDEYREAYELGVNNLLQALSAHGAMGEFEEGIHYARFTTESLLHAAHAMAVAGDRRAIEHPYLASFATWAVHHLQPGRMLVNCFDAVWAFVPREHEGWRSFLSLMVFCSGDKTANWALHDQFDGPSDDLAGLACRLIARDLDQNPPPLFAAYDRATMAVWRDGWSDDGDGVWIRGGHELDQHDHRDRGHVNLIRRGKPILIEAGTPDYSNPDIFVHYQSDAGHNVLRLGSFFPSKPYPIFGYATRYEGWQKRGCVAPIEVRRLDAAGGSVVVDATRCYAALERWHREVDWSNDEMTIHDDVRIRDGGQDIILFRWHLGTEQDVAITADGRSAEVHWADARIHISADSALSIRQFKAPDATVTGEDDRQHTCLEVQSAGAIGSIRVTTVVR